MDRASAWHERPGPTPWPILFASPPSTAAQALQLLWPALEKELEERKASMRANSGVCYVPPRVVAGGEHCFWLLQLDERVVLVVAFAGKRSATEAATNALLRTLIAGVGHQKVVEGSLQRDSLSTGWWGALLQWLPWANQHDNSLQPRAAADMMSTSTGKLPRLEAR